MLNDIKKIRLKAGLSQSKLARISGVSRSTIIRLEDQEDIDTKHSTWIMLATALECQITDFNIQPSKVDDINKIAKIKEAIELEKIRKEGKNNMNYDNRKKPI